MATLPTPEQSGGNILQIYKKYNIRPGEMLQIQVIKIKLMEMGKRTEDFEAGLKWLVEQGYLEQKEGKSDRVIFLTQKGFAKF